jgi:hypothetical protein
MDVSLSPPSKCIIWNNESVLVVSRGMEIFSWPESQVRASDNSRLKKQVVDKTSLPYVNT